MPNIFKTVTFGNRFENSEKIIGLLRKDFVYKNIYIENVSLNFVLAARILFATTDVRSRTKKGEGRVLLVLAELPCCSFVTEERQEIISSKEIVSRTARKAVNAISLLLQFLLLTKLVKRTSTFSEFDAPREMRMARAPSPEARDDPPRLQRVWPYEDENWDSDAKMDGPPAKPQEQRIVPQEQRQEMMPPRMSCTQRRLRIMSRVAPLRQ